MSYVAQALSLVAVPLYLGTLGAESYGLVLAALALNGYLGFADAGFSWGSMILMGHAYGRRDREEMAHIFSHGLLLAALSGAVAITVAFGLFTAASHGWRLPMFRGYPASDGLVLIVGIQAAMGPCTSMFYNVYYALQEAQLPALLQGVSRLVGSVLGIVLVLWTEQAWIILGANLLASAVMGLWAAVGLRRKHSWIFRERPRVDYVQLRLQVRTGAKNFLLQMSRVLVGTAPVVMLSSLVGPAVVPMYTLSVSLFQIVLGPIQNSAAYAQTAFADAWAAGHKDWIVSVVGRALAAVIWLGGLIVAVGGHEVGALVTLVSGGKLHPPLAMGYGVAAMCVTTTLVTLGQYVLTGINRQKYAAMSEALSGLLCFGFVWAVVSWFGPSGVGWGCMLASMTGSFWVLRHEICRHLGLQRLPVPAGFLGRVSFGALCAAVALLLTPAYDPDSVGLLALAIGSKVFAGMLIYVGIAMALGTLSLQDIRPVIAIIGNRIRISR